MKNFPVFVFPVSLEFYLSARHTHKQLLTVYNPYDFSVNFKVLCTAPNKFTVIDPEGVIAPQSCIDIVVRYTQPSVLHCNTTEKFRITMYDRNTQQALGKRDIPTKLIEGEPINPNLDSLGDSFHPLSSRVTPQKQAEEHTQVKCNHPHHRINLRPRNRLLFAAPEARTVSRKHSPLVRALHKLNELLASAPDLDVFASNWRMVCLECLRYCEAMDRRESSVIYFISREHQPVNVVAVAVSICCIAALLLPTQPETVVQSQFPDWLHIGSNLKLVFSFVLGLVSMLVLRP